MKTANVNVAREDMVRKLFDFCVAEVSNDIGMTAAGTFNFPIAMEDGEEGWVEIVVKIPRYDDDEGYALREEHALKLKEKADKAEERKAKAEADRKKKEAKKEEKA